MVDSLAGLLHRLVTEDQDTKDLFTRLFILMLHGQDFTKETRNLTTWAIDQWLIGELGKRQLSELLIHQVLREETFIRPGIYRLLTDYLDSDFDNVSNLMERNLIETVVNDPVKSSLFNTINKSAQDNLVDPYMYWSIID